MNQNKGTYSRRTALKMAAATSIATVGSSLFNRVSASEALLEDHLKGKVNHSVWRW